MSEEYNRFPVGGTKDLEGEEGGFAEESFILTSNFYNRPLNLRYELVSDSKEQPFEEPGAGLSEERFFVEAEEEPKSDPSRSPFPKKQGKEEKPEGQHSEVKETSVGLDLRDLRDPRESKEGYREGYKEGGGEHASISESIIFSQDRTQFFKEGEAEGKVKILWKAFFLHFLGCSLFLPLYVGWMFFVNHQKKKKMGGLLHLKNQKSAFEQCTILLFSSFYYFCFLLLIILYGVHVPSFFSPSELFLPIFLHFFTCFVWIFSSQNVIRTLSTLSPFSTPTSVASSSPNSGSATSSSSTALEYSREKYYFEEYEKFKRRQEERMADKRMHGKMFKLGGRDVMDPLNVKKKEMWEEAELSIPEIAQLLFEKTKQLERRERRKEMEVFLPFFSAILFSSIPQVLRVWRGVEVNFEFKPYFYVMIVISFFVNFQISFISFYVLFQTILHLKKRLTVAQLFSELNSESHSFLYSLFFFRLDSLQNVWGWLSLRGFLMREGKKDQIIPEITLSTYLSFLIPLTLSLLSQIFFDKNKLSIFVVSGVFFAALLFLYIIICISTAAQIRSIYQNVEVLLVQQIDINYQICTTPPSNPRRIDSLKNLISALDKIVQFINSGEGKGILMRILGFEVTERLSQVLIASAISLASAGLSKILVF